MWVHIAILPPAQHPIDCTFLEIVYVCVPTFEVDRNHNPLTHTHVMRRPWPPQKEELDVRLLLFRGCLLVESSRDGVIRRNAAAASS